MENQVMDTTMDESPVTEIDESNTEISPKDQVRNQISLIADDKSLLGTTSDAATYAVDDTAMDILAVANSADSSYKKERIALFEQLHGEGSWSNAVTFSKEWFDARKDRKIKLPIDVKGIASVFNDVAERGTGVAIILKKAAEQTA